MKKNILTLVILILTSSICWSQNNHFSEYLQQINSLNINQLSKNINPTYPQKENTKQSLIPLFYKQNQLLPFQNLSQTKNNDTLFIGTGIQDSLYISGNYIHNGTILVLNQGKLIFENANATITGDIIAWGYDTKIEIKNSTIHMPQNFIYERAIIAAGNSKIIIENSTLNFSGFSHNLVITDSAYVKMQNLHKHGFTTCGLSKKAKIDFVQCDKAEFVMTNQSFVNIQQSDFVLLWHHIPAQASLDFEFPNGDTLSIMNFNNTLQGVQNIDYQYSIVESTNVLWGLMPEPQSTVLIQNSTIRTLGVWFKNDPIFNVSGLVNNSQYANFNAPLSSHNLQLINSFVQTWSLYLFEEAHGNIQNCIVGEIGAFTNNQFTLNNSIVDGSGGYLFTESTSTGNCIFSSLNCDFHTNDFAFGVMAYSNQNFGRSIAKDKSIMIFAQSNLMQLPEIYNDAMVWFLKLEGNTMLNKSENTPIIGSAWIQKASSFYPTELAWYQLHYRKLETDPWIPICHIENQLRFSEILYSWDTQNVDEGSYTLKLTMCDNSVDSNKVEVFRQFVISDMTKIETTTKNSFVVYPNPAKKGTNLIIESPKISSISKIELIDNIGRIHTIQSTLFNASDSFVKINTRDLKPGVYLLNIYFEKEKEVQKIVVY